MTRFHPTAEDNLELGLYFSAGPKLPKWAPKAQRERRERVERALDGGGYHLQLYYTGRLDAAVPDTEEAEHRLADEYRTFAARFRARGRRPKASPFVVLTDAEIERLLTRPTPARIETVLGDDGQWQQVEGDAGLDLLGNLADLELRNLVERATWGGWRVTSEGARELLKLSHWFDSEVRSAEIRLLTDEAALTAVRARLAELPALPEDDEYEPPPNRSVTAVEREGARWVLSAYGAAEGDPRRREGGDRDASHTFVTEIADRHVVRRRWVREILIRLGCPGARCKRAPLPAAWFRTPAGARFWELLIVESRRQRAEIRAKKERLRATGAELAFASASQNQPDSYRLDGRFWAP